MFRRGKFRRRRFVRNRFLWVSTTTLVITPNQGNANWVSSSVFPAGRSAWLHDAAARRGFSIRRIDCWLNIHFLHPGGEANAGLPGSVYPYLIKTTTGSDNSPDENFNPFDAPDIPGTITSWTSDPEESAGDPFIWRTVIFPQVMQTNDNAQVSVQGYNNVNFIQPGGGLNRVFQGLDTANIWRPNLRLRTRIPMRRNNELTLGMQMSAPAQSAQVQLFAHMLFWGR